MPFIDAFLRDSVTVYSFSHEGDGEPIYGAREERKARVELNPTLVSRVAGDTSIDAVPAKARMFCKGNPIPMRSKVTYDGKDYIVLQCDVLKGFTFSHLEVILG